MRKISKTVGAVSGAVSDTFLGHQHQGEHQRTEHQQTQPNGQSTGASDIDARDPYIPTSDTQRLYDPADKPIPTTTNTIPHLTPQTSGYKLVRHIDQFGPIPPYYTEASQQRDAIRQGEEGSYASRDNRVDEGFSESIPQTRTGGSTTNPHHEQETKSDIAQLLGSAEQRYGTERTTDDGISRTGHQNDPSYNHEGIPRQRYVGNESTDDGIGRADGRDKVQSNDQRGTKGSLRPSYSDRFQDYLRAGLNEDPCAQTGDNGYRKIIGGVVHYHDASQARDQDYRQDTRETGDRGLRGTSGGGVTSQEFSHDRKEDHRDRAAGKIAGGMNYSHRGGQEGIDTQTGGPEYREDTRTGGTTVNDDTLPSGMENMKITQPDSDRQDSPAREPHHISIKETVPPVGAGAAGAAAGIGAGNNGTTTTTSTTSDAPTSASRDDPISTSTSNTATDQRPGHIGGGEFPAGHEAPQEPADVYIKSTGLAADGGDFDAARAGAGREADRLLEVHGVTRTKKKPPTAADPATTTTHPLNHFTSHESSKHSFLPSVPILHSHHNSADSGRRRSSSGPSSSITGGGVSGLVASTATNPVMGSTSGGGGGVPGLGSGVVGTQAPGPAKKFVGKVKDRVIHLS
ncbi:hypothetical protein DFH27DRAFT_6086 [Peziza echinospora]|nr:hypothetical protein DFH27DRAFT_6086 [Peziza echinospora]